MDIPVESSHVKIPLAQPIIQIIEEWKNQIGNEYHCSWTSGENDMYWTIYEKFGKMNPEELLLWKNAFQLLPKLDVRVSGLHRMNTPFGTEWWISFNTSHQKWEAWQSMVNRVMNGDMMWIPRMKIPIGITPPEMADKLYPLLSKNVQLPWQGMEWEMLTLIVPEVCQEEMIFHSYELNGSKDSFENPEKASKDFLYQFGVSPNYRGYLIENKHSYQPKPKPKRFPKSVQPPVILPEGMGGHIRPRSRPAPF